MELKRDRLVSPIRRYQWINGRGDEVGDLISLAIDRDRIQ
jgi:hypothetical protein